MFIDARTLAPGTVVEADICIVGAGGAGITLTRALANEKPRIALFESGGLEFDPKTQELYAGENVGRSCPPLDVDRLRYFGGTTNHWSGGCNPFHESDFQDWPFERRELDPYYTIAQTVCQLGPNTYKATDWETATHKHIDFGPSARFLTGMYQYSPPTRFGQVYRQDLEQSKQVSVYLNANLVEIEAAPSSGQVSALHLSRLDRKRFSARGRYFVLATGAIENARLLLCSTKSSLNGLGNEFDLVGRYFMDHGVARDYASILLSGPASASFYEDHEVLGQIVSGYFYATPETAENEGFSPFCISLTPVGYPDTDLARSSLNAIYQNLRMGRLPANSNVDNIYEAVKWKLEKWRRRLFASEPSQFATLYIAGAPPDPESRVTLTDSVDALGLRRVKLDWRLPSDFDEKMRRAHGDPCQ